MKLTITSKRKVKQLLFFFTMILLLDTALQSQPCNVGVPQLFGTPLDKIVCRDGDAALGVNGSVGTQKYFFDINNGSIRSIGGPLIGNGGSLSVAARVASSADVGQYYVETRDDNFCWATSPGFYVYYGNIDDLSITAWGNNSVSFSWASSGRSPYVRYEYAVTTQSNPDLIPDADTATTFNTSATVNGLIAGTQYYIHVSVYKVYKQPFGNGVGSPEVLNQNCANIPWSTIRFTSCAGAAPIGSITTAAPIPVVCTGYGTNLTASQGLTYQWYRNGTSLAPQGNTATINITQPGTYSTFITTSAGCQGIAYSKYIRERTTTAGAFTGGGSFCAGEEVKLRLRATQPDQYYEIMKDGQLVTPGFWGIGTSFGSPPTDTMHYDFIINSAAQAGNYKITTYNSSCPPVIFGNQDVVLLSTGSTGTIIGTATVPQHATNTCNITFTGSGGVKPYTFTYNINGGANQTITTTGVNTTAIVTRSQATLGTFVYTLVKITDAPGCTGIISGPVSATVNVVTPAPDLTTAQDFGPSQINPGGTIEEAIVVRNIGPIATSGTITVNATVYSGLSGLTASQVASGTVTINGTPYTASAGWSFNTLTGDFTSTTPIAAGGNSTIRLRITRGTGGSAGARGSVNHTLTIPSGSGGELPSQSSNNSINNPIAKN